MCTVHKLCQSSGRTRDVSATEPSPLDNGIHMLSLNNATIAIVIPQQIERTDMILFTLLDSMFKNVPDTEQLRYRTG